MAKITNKDVDEVVEVTYPDMYIDIRIRFKIEGDVVFDTLCGDAEDKKNCNYRSLAGPKEREEAFLQELKDGCFAEDGNVAVSVINDYEMGSDCKWSLNVSEGNDPSTSS